MDRLNEEHQYFEEVNPGLIRRVGTGLKILDVGCSYGALGEAMTKKGNVVFGLDISRAAIEKARTRVHFAAVADITRTGSLPPEIAKERFDLVVMGDIVEHVYDPLNVLVSARKLMKDDGRLLLSVPNVANWLNRLQLLLGRWEYAVSGVMDRTHLRFFTLRSVRRLVRAAGYEVVGVSATPYFSRAIAVPIRNLLFPGSRDKAPEDPGELMESPLYMRYMRYVYPVESAIAQCWKQLFAFQFIITAKFPGKVSRESGRGRPA